jgi:hypothetical protein
MLLDPARMRSEALVTRRRVVLSIACFFLAIGAILGVAAIVRFWHPPLPDGLVEVGLYVPNYPPTDPAQLDAYDKAVRLMGTNPNDFAPVWWDASEARVRLTPVTPRGVDRVREAFGSDLIVMADPAAKSSKADLVELMDRLTDARRSDVEGATYITTSEVDPVLDRAVVTVTKYVSPLGEYLVAHFSLDQIAIRIDPNAGSAQGG